MKKYPYIGSRVNGIVLFTGVGTGICLESTNKYWLTGNEDVNWDESAFEDITHEYLSNTKIIIESPEHSEFVRQLALNGGFGQVPKFKNDSFFYVSLNGDETVSYGLSAGVFNLNENKEIKIPLPKTQNEEQKRAPQMPEKPIYTKQMKDNGDLPPVGSVVIKSTPRSTFEDEKFRLSNMVVPNHIEKGVKLEVIAHTDICGKMLPVVKTEDYIITSIILSHIEPTKAPEEVMIDKLTEKLTGFTDIYAGDELSIQKAIASAIIYGEILGLTYKGE